MKRFGIAALLVLLLAAGAVWAQYAEQTEQKTREMTKEKTDGDVDVEKLKGILHLPEDAREARTAGIPEEEVRQAMDEARKRGLSPNETGEILRESGRAASENGEVEHFGTFVGEQLDQGKRGKELSEAIRAEHQARGKGKGHAKAKGKDGMKGQGKANKGADSQKQAKKQSQNKHQNQNMNQGDGQHQEQEAEGSGSGKGQSKGSGGKKGGKGNGKNR